jgi:Domain of unknown function (DUF4203)
MHFSFRLDTPFFDLNGPVPFGVMLTAYGLVVMMFGYRFYRLWAALMGIAAGAILALVLSTKYLPDYALLHYFTGILGAGLGCAVFYYVSVFLLGATLSTIIMFLLHMGWLIIRDVYDSVAVEQAVQQAAVFYAVIALTAGILAFIIRRPFLIVITAAGGAAFTTIGAAAACGEVDKINLSTFRIDLPTFELVAIGVTFAVLSVVGAIVQWKTAKLPITIHADDGEEKKPKKSKAKGKGKSKADTDEE